MTNSSALVQASMLMARMSVKDYIITSNEKDRQEFEQYWEQMSGQIAQAKIDITAEKGKAQLDSTEAELQTYIKGFSAVGKLKQQTNDLVKVR